MGGLFPQFRRDSENKFVIDEAGVRRMAAAQLAINIVNNKSDGVYDKLLPDTQVCCVDNLFWCGICYNLSRRDLLLRLRSSNCSSETVRDKQSTPSTRSSTSLNAAVSGTLDRRHLVQQPKFLHGCQYHR